MLYCVLNGKVSAKMGREWLKALSVFRSVMLFRAMDDRLQNRIEVHYTMEQLLLFVELAEQLEPMAGEALKAQYLMRKPVDREVLKDVEKAFCKQLQQEYKEGRLHMLQTEKGIIMFERTGRAFHPAMPMEELREQRNQIYKEHLQVAAS